MYFIAIGNLICSGLRPLGNWKRGSQELTRRNEVSKFENRYTHGAGSP